MGKQIKCKREKFPPPRDGQRCHIGGNKNTLVARNDDLTWRTVENPSWLTSFQVYIHGTFPEPAMAHSRQALERSAARYQQTLVGQTLLSRVRHAIERKVRRVRPSVDGSKAAKVMHGQRKVNRHSWASIAPAIRLPRSLSQPLMRDADAQAAAGRATGSWRASRSTLPLWPSNSSQLQLTAASAAVGARRQMRKVLHLVRVHDRSQWPGCLP